MKIGSWLEEKNPISAPVEVKAAMWTWPLLDREGPPGKEILWTSIEGKTDQHLHLIRYQAIQCKPPVMSQETGFFSSAAQRTCPWPPAGALAASLHAGRDRTEEEGRISKMLG